MSREIRIIQVKFKKREGYYHKEKIYVSKERQTAYFQLRLQQIQGFQVCNQKINSWLTGGLNDKHVSLEALRTIGANLGVGKKDKLIEDYGTVLEQDGEYSFPYITKHDLETSKHSQKYLEDLSKITDRNFYAYFLQGMFYETGIVYTKDKKKALELFTRGYKHYGCQSSAVKIFHLMLDQNENIYTSEENIFDYMIGVFGEVVLKYGIIEIEGKDYEFRSPLLHYFSVMLDTSIDFQNYFFQVLSQIKEIYSKVWNSDRSIKAVDIFKTNKNILYKLLLLILFEVDYSERYFVESISVLNELRKFDEYKELNSFVGDLHHPGYIGSQVEFTLITRLLLYIEGKNDLKTVMILYRSLSSALAELNFETFNTGFQKIAELTNKRDIPLHPQMLSILLEYYSQGGKLDFRVNFPLYYRILPRNKIKNLLEPQPSSIISSDSSAIKFFENFHTKSLDSLATILNFLAINGDFETMRSYFCLLFNLKEEFATQIAIKCLKNETVVDSFSVILTNQEKGRILETKFERAIQGYSDIFDSWIKYLEEEVDQENTGLEKRLFQRTSSEYSESYIFAEMFSALIEYDVPEDLVLNAVKIAFSFAVAEIDAMINGDDPYNFYSYLALFKIMHFLGNNQILIELVKMLLFGKIGEDLHFNLASAFFYKQLPSVIDTSTLAKYLVSELSKVIPDEDVLVEEEDTFLEDWLKIVELVLKEGSLSSIGLLRKMPKHKSENQNSLKLIQEIIRSAKLSLKSFVDDLKANSNSFRQNLIRRSHIIHYIQDQLQSKLMNIQINDWQSRIKKRDGIEQIKQLIKSEASELSELLKLEKMFKNEDDGMLGNKDFQRLRDNLFKISQLREFKEAQFEKLVPCSGTLSISVGEMFSSIIRENGQYVKILKVKVASKNHINNLLQNLPISTNFHPLFLGVLGAYCFDRLNFFEINFVFENYTELLQKRNLKMFKILGKKNNFANQHLYNLYKVAIARSSLQLSGICTAFLNSTIITINSEGEIKILIPFFENNFDCLVAYVKNVIEKKRFNLLDYLSVSTISKVTNNKYKSSRLSELDGGFLLAQILWEGCGWAPQTTLGVENVEEYLERRSNKSFLKKKQAFIKTITKKTGIPADLVTIFNGFETESSGKGAIFNAIHLLDIYILDAGLSRINPDYFLDFMEGYGDFKPNSDFERKSLLPRNIKVVKIQNVDTSSTIKYTHEDNLVLTIRKEEGFISTIVYYYDNDTRLEIEYSPFADWKDRNGKKKPVVNSAKIHCIVKGKEAHIEIGEIEHDLFMPQLGEFYQELVEFKDSPHYHEYINGGNNIKEFELAYRDEYTKRNIFEDVMANSEENFKLEFRLKLSKIIKNFEGLTELFVEIKDNIANIGLRTFENKESSYFIQLFDIYGNLVYGRITDEFVIDFEAGTIVKPYFPKQFTTSCIFSSHHSSSGYYETDFHGSIICGLSRIPSGYSSLSQRIGKVDSQFVISSDASENFYCGSLMIGEYDNGIIFDSDNNFYSFSNQKKYRGQTYFASRDLRYIGELANGMPHGYGLLLKKNTPNYIGEFRHGFPLGKGFVFNENSELKFFGYFDKETPIYGILISLTNEDCYEGLVSFSNSTKAQILSSKIVKRLRKKAAKYARCQEIIIDSNMQISGDILFPKLNPSLIKIEGLFNLNTEELTGKFRQIFKNGAIYGGELFKGDRNGFGYFITPSNMIMIGYWQRSYFKGCLFLVHTASPFKIIFGTFEFQIGGKLKCKNQVRAVLKNGDIYQGEMYNNSFAGYGIYRSNSSRIIYKGQFVANRRHGIGELTNPDGTVYKGEFRNNEMNGFGELTLEEIIIKGFWQNDCCIYGTLKPVNKHILVNERVNTLNIVFDKPINYGRMKESNFSGYFEAFLKNKLTGNKFKSYSNMEFMMNSHALLLSGKLKTHGDSPYGSNRRPPTRYFRKISLGKQDKEKDAAIDKFKNLFERKKSNPYSTIALKIPSKKNIVTKGSQRSRRSVRNLANIEDSIMSIIKISGYMNYSKDLMIGNLSQDGSPYCLGLFDIHLNKGIGVKLNIEDNCEYWGELSSFTPKGAGILHFSECSYASEFEDGHMQGNVLKYRKRLDYIAVFEKGQKQGLAVKYIGKDKIFQVFRGDEIVELRRYPPELQEKTEPSLLRPIGNLGSERQDN